MAGSFSCQSVDLFKLSVGIQIYQQGLLLLPTMHFQSFYGIMNIHTMKVWFLSRQYRQEGPHFNLCPDVT